MTARSTRGPSGLLDWSKLVLSMLFGGLVVYLIVINTDFWIWVGNSAFRGIRARRDVGLGIQCVLATLAPMTAAVLAFLWARRRSDTYHGPIACAAGITFPVVVATLLWGVLLSGPF